MLSSSLAFYRFSYQMERRKCVRSCLNHLWRRVTGSNKQIDPLPGLLSINPRVSDMCDIILI